ncbi:hypothetical protein FJQ98_01770 [Lysinibacillus agricola]|uniref:NADH dehydrogenase n=1 Tax=Lysinibacillus agricola TaxID=2590012 RepID=A0ABX7AUM6_9BACI|nr:MULTISPECIES: hypothetical protein [Lysinibacillus]KOS61310.1 hypothetical protein AN161_18725 [Lysinibacillus sp. FJAT-14222]QQP12845.1 hypothetical protein FJQ98_01770 [Lysinibacillus agricola]
MNKWLKSWSIFIFSIGGIVIILIFWLVFSLFSFKASMIPDRKEEEKVISQAEQYIQEKYPTMKYEISHVLYDNDKEYPDFEYAAVILNTETQKTFKVYENKHTKQMEDNIIIQEEAKFIEQLRPKVYSYITKIFGEPESISFTPSYTTKAAPTLNIRLNNKKEEINEDMFQSFIDYLQHELNVKHAYVNFLYDNETEAWSTDF